MRHDQLDTVGSRLAYVRGEASQADFAPKVGIAKNTLGNYERGDREIGAGALAGYMQRGWSANWLLTGEGPERLAAAPTGGVAESPASYGGALPVDWDTWARAKRLVLLAADAIEPKPGAELFADQVATVYAMLVGKPHDNSVIPVIVRQVEAAIRAATVR